MFEDGRALEGNQEKQLVFRQRHPRAGKSQQSRLAGALVQEQAEGSAHLPFIVQIFLCVCVSLPSSLVSLV